MRTTASPRAFPARPQTARPALGLAVALVLLGSPVAAQNEPTAPPAATAPTLLAGDELDTLLARVALYPDPLLALVLQASTLPLEVVQAARFLDKHAKDSSLEPDSTWDTSTLGLLNYPTVVQMMNEDIDWTEQLGTAVVEQLPDVQASVQQVRAELQVAGALVSNDKQTVVVDQDTIKIEPATKDVIYVPEYEPVPASAPAPAAVTPSEAVTSAPAPAAPVDAGSVPAPVAPAYTAPAPTAYATAAPAGYAVPPVTYSDPYASFWSHTAAFAGGAVVGGVLGYAINDDDDDDDDFEIDLDEDVDWDDVDWDEVDRGDIERGDVQRGGINIEDSNVIVGGNRSKSERQTQLAQSQLKANRQRGTSVTTQQRAEARARVQQQPGAATARGNARTTGTRTATAPRTGQAQARAPAQQRAEGRSATVRGRGSAVDVKPQKQVRKEADRGARSRTDARQATAAPTRSPQASQRQATIPRQASPPRLASTERPAMQRQPQLSSRARPARAANVSRASARGASSRGGGRRR